MRSLEKPRPALNGKGKPTVTDQADVCKTEIIVEADLQPGEQYEEVHLDEDELAICSAEADELYTEAARLIGIAKPAFLEELSKFEFLAHECNLARLRKKRRSKKRRSNISPTESVYDMDIED